MLTRRHAFKIGFGAAIYALFGKFLPKKVVPVDLPNLNVICDPLCPPGCIYFIPQNLVLDEANRKWATLFNLRMDQSGEAMRDMLNSSLL